MTTASSPRSVVVVGAGHGGVQVAMSLRDHGFDGEVTVVGAEPGLPYQRPPLSKAFLAGDPHVEETTILRPASFYDDHDILLRSGVQVLDVHREDRLVRLSTGERLGYGHLVLATGAIPIALPVPGAELTGVMTLRTLVDARCLRERIITGERVVVVGGGFIGMEVAAAAATAGREVTVLEAADCILGRVLSPEVGEHLTAAHVDRGVTVRTGAVVAELIGRGGAVTGVRLAGDEVVRADTVVVGIGVRPDVDLARGAGLAVDNGVVVDEQLSTDDPHISAIGDCVSYPSVHGGPGTRLESVQNAADQARHVAARIWGVPGPRYAAVPWFWTHQYDRNVQIAGIAGPSDRRTVVGDPAAGGFSVARFDGARLVCVESVNSPADHLASRTLLGQGRSPTPEQTREAGFSLKAYARS